MRLPTKCGLWSWVGSVNPWEAGPRSSAELKEAAACWEQAAALCDAPAGKAHFARLAVLYRSEAEAM